MELTQVIIEGIQNMKGQRIVNIDLSKVKNAVCTNFIICEGTSNTQVSAIAGSVAKHTHSVIAEKPIGKEGEQEATWVVLDYGSVMVHVFQRETRELYNIEGLWADGDISEIAEL